MVICSSQVLLSSTVKLASRSNDWLRDSRPWRGSSPASRAQRQSEFACASAKKRLRLEPGRPRPTLAANLSRSGVVGWSPYSTDLLISADEWEGTASARAGRLAVGVCCYPTLPSLLLGGLHAPTAGPQAFPRNARSPSGCAHRRWRRWQRRRRHSASLLLDARRAKTTTTATTTT